jgi:uncharacterized protein (DUF305 family)
MTRKNLVRAALAVLTTGLVLAGCGNSGHDMGGSTTSTGSAAAPAGDQNYSDIKFAEDMIPHHAGAIEMAKLVQGRTSNSKVLDLASRIEQAQGPEIKTMTEWLKAWGADGPTMSMPGMDHGTSMPGMMTAAEMTSLQQAKDADFDRLFLELMIKHHQGAIDMANTELRQGKNADAKKLAQEIITAQQSEITEMQGLLQTGG